MTFNINVDLSGPKKFIEILRTQAPAELAKALTFTAERVQARLREEIAKTFDSPTEYTLNSLRKKTAIASNLTAYVWVKDEAGKGGTPAIRFLGPEIYGGLRGQKGFERGLQGAGILPAGWIAVPSKAVQLDANGNVPRSLYRQVLSQLRVQRVGGHESRTGGAADDKKKRAKTIARQGGEFFAGRPGGKGSKHPLGIWFRQGISFDDHKQSIVSPIFIFLEKAKYNKRFRFFEVAQEAVDKHFPIEFDRRWRKFIGLKDQ